MIETLWYPCMINQLSPWHIYSILKARLVPILTFWYITSYALGFGSIVPKSSLMVLVDLFCATALQVIYLVHVSADEALPSDIIWLVPSLIWYFVMSPGIIVWSLVTILDDSWGNAPRAMDLRDGAKLGTNGAWTGSRVFKQLLSNKHVAIQVLWLGIVLIAISRASLSSGV